MRHLRQAPKGFTLIEILIVVIILGILAAIVIPQFSSATTDARTSSVQSTVQTLRSQVALYRLQHNDKLPGGGTSTTFDGTSSAATPGSFWGDLLSQTDATGALYKTGATTGPFGPYMQDIPANALNTLTSVVDGNGTAPSGACGYTYDYDKTSPPTGKVWGSNADSSAYVVP